MTIEDNKEKMILANELRAQMDHVQQNHGKSLMFQRVLLMPERQLEEK
jgi:hypothetical protein